MAKIFLTPAKPGLIVRDPVTAKPLEASGEFKEREPYWIRRIKAGDVIAAAPAPVEKTDTSAKKDRVK